MKKYYFLACLAIASVAAQAQNTYINDRISGSQDVIGTARYVGMGGALGALGADLSTMSFNPAGIGLYRKSDIALTFGGLWNTERIKEENSGKGTFDQIGFVYALKTGSRDCPFFNVGFNYQKKANFHYNFYAPFNLNGLSQMDQIAELVSYGYDSDYNLAGIAVDNEYLTPIYVPNPDKPGEEMIGRYYNKFSGTYARLAHHSAGSQNAFDINFSANIRDRGYVGMTIGAENINYRGWSTYYEENSYINENNQEIYGDYSLFNDFHVHGYGMNVKFGGIVRPIEDSPFRIGFAFETPTWYRMKNSTYFDLSDHVENVRTDTRESYLDYNITTPWKVRASMGSTVGTSFAWGVDYEFSNHAGTKIGYPNYDDWNNSSIYSSMSNDRDRAMNLYTKSMLRGQHTVKAGIEFRPVSAFAIRMGYNFVSSPYNKQVEYDQFSIDSWAMNYETGTSYMRPDVTNIVTFGLGYKFKKFYIDLAYKVRSQKADVYAFDTNFTNPDSDFSVDNPELSGVTVAPANVNLTRQTITCTLGLKF